MVGAQLSEDDVAALHGGTELAAVVAERMNSSIDVMADAITCERLAALAWMIDQGTLEVRVVLPRGKDGHPLPASASHDYYHPKTGIFTDSQGNQVVFVGSINESEQAWRHNYELFSVYCSWKPGLQPYITTHTRYFERLWNNQEDGWISLAIPEAVRARLLTYSPREAPSKDPLEKTGEPGKPEEGPSLPKSTRERILFQFLRDAPLFPNGHLLGRVATTVNLWPHQSKVVDRLVGTFPARYMLCDEVGLGKTLEGGGALKELSLSGRARRCLILAPKSVCRQWQEELYEKFLLNVPLYDGSVFRDYFRRELPAESANPWNAFPVTITSSQLAKRRDRMSELFQAEPWDLILVDEAHHARRKDFLSGQYRRNRLLSLLMGPQEKPDEAGLARRTRGLILLTATPMQVDPREVWDLLAVLGLGGRWGASDANFTRFFDEIRQGSEADWPFLLKMVRDYLDHGGAIDPAFDSVALRRIGLVTWETIKNLPYSSKAVAEISQLNPVGKAVLSEFVRRHTPLARFIMRNTRALLREYQKRGLLGGKKVPTRRPHLNWIKMRDEEMLLYLKIEEYISHFYKRYEAERKGLGFIMTVYRRRLTSSFYAMSQSLTRRLKFLRGEPEALPNGGLTDEDVEDDDLDSDVLEELATPERSIYHDEIAYIEDFMGQIHPLAADSKVEQLLRQLDDLFRKRETIIIFTLYTDTMDYLREHLRAVYGQAVACYSGRGGEVWDGTAWKGTTKDTIKKDFLAEKIKILVGTDALSEGLNLQSCGMMINYDMPWNPMRVEQRIGRIDRIGQKYDEVWIHNYFYENTVEAQIYRALEGRINWFETVVGDLQPILARVARVIQTAAMETGGARQLLLTSEIEAIKRDIDERQVNSLSLDKYLPEDVIQAPKSMPPVTQAEIECSLLQALEPKGLISSDASRIGTYRVWDEGVSVPSTFNPELFDRNPNSLKLISYGEPLFHGLLEAVDTLRSQDFPSWMVRKSSENPALCVYYSCNEGVPRPILTLSDLVTCLEKPKVSLSPDQLTQVDSDFSSRIEEFKKTVQQHNEAQMEEARSALVEKGKQLLLEATYVDIALSRFPGSVIQGPNLAGFTKEAVRNLKRFNYPITPLMRLIDLSEIAPSPSDPTWVKLQDLTMEGLKKRFELVKANINDLLLKLNRSWN
ncbi:MAG: helicase-related protein [Dehalogenimonas sp.]